MQTLEIQVGASEDDAGQDGGGSGDGDMFLDFNSINVQSEATNTLWGGFRFVSGQFPAQGTTVDVAYIKVYIHSTSYDDPNLNIHFEELAAPAAFTLDAFNITVRDRTENSTSWIADTIGVGWTNSPSLSGVGSPIQELFDVYSPTAIVVIFRPNTDILKRLYSRSWDYNDNTLGAILHLEWEEVPVGWTGKMSGVTNPAKIMKVDVANIATSKGVA